MSKVRNAEKTSPELAVHLTYWSTGYFSLVERRAFSKTSHEQWQSHLSPVPTHIPTPHLWPCVQTSSSLLTERHISPNATGLRQTLTDPNRFNVDLHEILFWIRSKQALLQKQVVEAVTLKKSVDARHEKKPIHSRVLLAEMLGFIDVGRAELGAAMLLWCDKGSLLSKPGRTR